jgi:predicted transposase/invertase (TIGR01784 family)
MVYLDPKNDITFKKVFAQHPHLLISFLNALLPLEEGGDIVSLEYMHPELLPIMPHQKNTVVDIRCKDAQGRQFLVEMQMLWTDSFPSRVLYNTAKAYTKQLKRGEKYTELPSVYSLSIINQVFSKQQLVWYHHYRLAHQSLPNTYVKGVEFVLIELANFIPNNFAKKRMQVLWMRYLKDIKNKTTMIPPELLEDPAIAQAVDLLKEGAYTEAELASYEKYWDIVSTNASFLDDARREGRIEERMKTAQKLLHRGFDTASIVDITGLSAAEVEGFR